MKLYRKQSIHLTKAAFWIRQAVKMLYHLAQWCHKCAVFDCHRIPLIGVIRGVNTNQMIIQNTIGIFYCKNDKINTTD